MTDNLGAFWSILVALGFGIQWKVEFLLIRVGLGPCVADELSKGRV